MALKISCGPRVKEASTGYFYDLHMTRVHGGKTWMAPKVLIREDVSLPEFCVRNCMSVRVCVESTLFSEHCWQSSRQWRQNTHYAHVRWKSVRHSHAIDQDIRGVLFFRPASY